MCVCVNLVHPQVKRSRLHGGRKIELQKRKKKTKSKKSRKKSKKRKEHLTANGVPEVEYVSKELLVNENKARFFGKKGRKWLHGECHFRIFDSHFSPSPFFLFPCCCFYEPTVGCACVCVYLFVLLAAFVFLYPGECVDCRCRRHPNRCSCCCCCFILKMCCFFVRSSIKSTHSRNMRYKFLLGYNNKALQRWLAASKSGNAITVASVSIGVSCLHSPCLRRRCLWRSERFSSILLNGVCFKRAQFLWYYTI